ncbi:MAG: HD domain-containing protein [Candidatus Aminicenantaceae bacterium]
MQEKIKNVLTNLISAIQAVKIYTPEHPQFNEFIDRAYKTLHDIFEDRAELIIGIVKGELAFEREIFFDLSKKLKPLIRFLEEREIERIVFRRDLHREELAKFITLLTTPQKNGETDLVGVLSQHGIRNIQAGKIKAPSMDLKEKVKKLRNYLVEYEGSLEKVHTYLETVINQDELDYMELKYDVFNFLDNLMSMYQEFIDLTTFRRKDLITFIHLLNVTVLSMHISAKLGYSKDDVLNVGIASLFHDIGKLYVSQKIVQKTDKLDREELTRMRHHTTLGAEILFKYIDTLGTLPVVVALEHHLRYDLKGYPKLAFPQKPHPASLIVSTCDVYDALSQRRSYKKIFPPDKIYNVMLKEKGSAFDPLILDKFFQIMGVWPVKSIVSLSDGRIAVVREQNKNDIFNPKVEVISPKKKKGIVDLVKVKIKIESYLDPWGQGKKYLKLLESEQQAPAA